jgi:hypothetical protein
MSLWDDIKESFNFELFQLEDVWKQIKEDPERIFIGAIDPFSSEMWSGITGKDYEPIINDWGGPTSERWGRAQEEGIDIEPARQIHGAVQDIAQSYAIGYGLDVAGGFVEGQGVDPKTVEYGKDIFQKAGDLFANPPEAQQEDFELAPEYKLRLSERPQQIMETFGRESAIAQPLDIPGVRVIHDPYEVQPTFGSV